MTETARTAANLPLDAGSPVPQGFALHRLIARAVVDFASATADVRRGPVLNLPAAQLAQTLDLYWSSMPEGQRTHMAAKADARTIFWLDVPLAEDDLRQARRSGIEAVACAAARSPLNLTTNLAAYDPSCMAGAATMAIWCTFRTRGKCRYVV